MRDYATEAKTADLHRLTWWPDDLTDIRELLAHGADVGVLQNHHASSKTTLLHNAANNGNAELAELLLQHGAVTQLTARLGPGQEGRRDGLTPLQLAAQRGNRAVAEIVRQHGAEYDIFSAAALGDIERIEALIVENPALLESRDVYGSSLLHWAVMGNQADAMRFFLECGIAIEGRNEFDETPLMIASQRCNQVRVEKGYDLDRSALIEPLIQAGAHVDLYAAAALGDTVQLLTMLDAYSDSARHVNGFGWTPLHWAARNGQTDAMELLLNCGAEIDARDCQYNTPLFCAAYLGGHGEAAEFLCKQGANVNSRNMWEKSLAAYDCGDCGIDFRRYGLWV